MKELAAARMPRLAVRNYGTRRHPDLHIIAGPWLIRLTDPYYGGTFGNGSRWSSGWHRWKDDPDYGC